MAGNESHDLRRDSLISRILVPAPEFSLIGPASADMADARDFIHREFSRSFNAHIEHYLPNLLTMRCLGAISGVIGMKPAGQYTDLYVEQYLDIPVEEKISLISDSPVSRGSVVEIGNLVALRKGVSQILFLIMAATLHEAGYQWIVFTATRTLRNNLIKLGFPMHSLGPADPSHLPDEELASWGNYYSTDPQVVVGDLSDAMQIINKRSLFRQVHRLYRSTIRTLAGELLGPDNTI